MYKIKLDGTIAQVNGKDVSLTKQESALLQALLDGNGKIVSRDELLKDAWGYKSAGLTRTVDVHVQRLRRKIGLDSIDTVYKCGYKLNS